MLVVFAVVLVATIRMFAIVPKGFVPDEDNDSLNINLQAAQGTSFHDMEESSQRVAEVVRQNPYVDTFFVSTGGSVGSMNRARINVQLVPRRERPLSAQQIAQQLRSRIIRFPRSQAFVSLPSSLHIGGHGGNSAYNLTVQSADTNALYPWARRLEDAVEPAARAAGRLRRHGDEESPGRPGRSIATRRRRSGSTRPRSRTRSTTASARNGRRRSTGSHRSIACCWSSTRDISSTPTR